MIKGIIFDFDGILADTEIIAYKIFEEILSYYGHEITLKDYSEFFSGKTKAINTEFLLKHYKLPITFDECLSLIDKIEERLSKKGTDLKPGVKELLNYLKENNIKAVVASSSIRERAMNILKDHNIDSYFDGFVFAEDISNSKPHPEVFLKAKQILGFENDELFVLEDSENGIMAGYNANIPVICIPDMKNPSYEYASKTAYILKSLNDVIDVINNKNNC